MSSLLPKQKRELKYSTNIYNKPPNQTTTNYLPKREHGVKIAKNVKAISRLLFILLLLLAIVVGAIFSYFITVGYYLNLEIKVPQNTTLSIVDVAFNPEDAETFNITILNPTYSPTEATITEISVATQDNIVHTIPATDPTLPLSLPKGQEETFVCQWNWEDFAGDNIKVIVLVEEGSGAAYKLVISPVGITVTTMGFDPADTTHFNMTVRNLPESIIDLTLTRITVTVDDGTVSEITEATPTLPYLLTQDSFNTFTVTWDWTNYRGRNVTITAYTSEGYTATRTQNTPKPVLLSVTDIAVDSADTTYFNVTVTNSIYSTLTANLTRIQLNLQDQTSVEVSTETPTLPYELPIGESITFKCLWDWTDRQNEAIIVVVETAEGYFGQSQTYVVG
jgi:hypothetical protein